MARGSFNRFHFILGAIAVSLLLVLVSVTATVLIMRSAADGDAAGAQGAGGDADAADGVDRADADTQAEPETDSVCGLTGEYEDITEEPPDTTWEMVGTTLAPSSSDGPGVVDDDGFRYCYAQTPAGALLAVANMVAVGTIPGLGERIAGELLADGPGRDAVLESIQAAETEPASEYPEFVGYRMLYADEENARVDIAAFFSEELMTVSAIHDLVWEDGDWKIVAGDDGQPAHQPRRINDTSDYVPWSAAG